MNLTHLSLFSGIGGIDLASKWARFETVGQVEMEDYQNKVLEKNFGNLPRWRDIKNVTANSFRKKTGLRTVTLISGGFPCQPYSIAGQRKGKNDDRYLWPEMLRVIQEINPTWVLGENVANFKRMGLDQALSDLESSGYEATAFIIPACAIQAFHRRDRVFIIANSNKELWKPSSIYPGASQESKRKKYTEWERFFVINRGNNNIEFRTEDKHKLCRNDDGISQELDEYRLNALGNAVVPQQVYPILQAIADIETNTKY